MRPRCRVQKSHLMRKASPASSISAREAVLLGLTIWALYVAAIRMPLLYYSNQNTKFLHGLALAFPDRLGADWTARTVDGLPLFSGLVYVVAAFATPVVFYLLEVAMLGIMCLSLLAIAWFASRGAGGLASIIAIGGSLVIMVSPAHIEVLHGVAGQYMTWGYLQPSEFGVLYLPALLFAQRGKPLAMVIAAIPAAFHPAYISISVVLLLVIVLSRWRDDLGLAPLTLLVSAGILALPSFDLALRFVPTDRETFKLANQILAFERIPHHSDPSRWAGWSAMCKLVLAILAIAFMPRGVMRGALVALILLAVCGTAVVAITGNAEVALWAPWRASIVIVPVSIAILLGTVVGAIFGRFTALWLRVGVCFVASTLAIWIAGEGIALKLKTWGDRNRSGYIQYVLDHHAPSDIYLTPPSNAGFRLDAMTAIFVSRKTHPYLDVEVIEWKRRIDLARRVYSEMPDSPQPRSVDCESLTELVASYPITHFLHPASRPVVDCGGLELLFRGDEAEIYRIVR